MNGARFIVFCLAKTNQAQQDKYDVLWSFVKKFPYLSGCKNNDLVVSKCIMRCYEDGVASGCHECIHSYGINVDKQTKFTFCPENFNRERVVILLTFAVIPSQLCSLRLRYQVATLARDRWFPIWSIFIDVHNQSKCAKKGLTFPVYYDRGLYLFLLPYCRSVSASFFTRHNWTCFLRAQDY